MLTEEDRESVRPIEEQPRFLCPSLVNQGTEPFADGHRECTGFRGACDGLAAGQRRLHKCEQLGRDTGAVDVATHIFATVSADVQPEHDVSATSIYDLYMHFVWRRRSCVRAPGFPRGWLRYFKCPSSDERKRRSH